MGELVHICRPDLETKGGSWGEKAEGHWVNGVIIIYVEVLKEKNTVSENDGKRCVSFR